MGGESEGWKVLHLDVGGESHPWRSGCSAGFRVARIEELLTHGNLHSALPRS